jgi:hypothetical protein
MMTRRSFSRCFALAAASAGLVAGTAHAEVAPLTDLELDLLCGGAGAPDPDGLSPTATVARCVAPGAPTRDAALRVCAAYDRRTLMPWNDAKAVAECVAGVDHGAARRSLRDAPEPRARTSPRAAAPRAVPGGALQSAILRETASFLVQRAEQEVSLFATEMVGRRLCERDSETASIFQQTCQLLDPDESPVLGATPAALRAAAEADLENFPAWTVTRLGARPRLACGVAVAWSFAREAMQGAELVVLLSDLEPIIAALPEHHACDQTMLDGLRKVAEAIRKVRNADGFDVPRMVRAAELDYLVSRAAPEHTRSGRLSDIGATATGVLRHLRELERAIVAFEREASPARRAALVTAGLRSIQPVISYAARVAGDDIDSQLRVALDGIAHIGNRQYTAAVVSLARIDGVLATRDGNLRNLLGLGATLAQADSSEAMRTAFHDAALPLQSWRRKNQPRWGVTLTGIVGVQPAWEVVVEDVGGGEVEAGPTVAPSLLVGADLHHGFGGSRFGLQFALLDLGAVASIRLDGPPEDSATEFEQEPEVRIEQVFSPGVYPYFGVGPFDFGVGASFVPSLRPGREGTAGTFEPLNVVRLGAFVGVDVSVLPLL